MCDIGVGLDDNQGLWYKYKAYDTNTMCEVQLAHIISNLFLPNFFRFTTTSLSINYDAFHYSYNHVGGFPMDISKPS